MLTKAKKSIKKNCNNKALQIMCNAISNFLSATSLNVKKLRDNNSNKRIATKDVSISRKKGFYCETDAESRYIWATTIE